ncbi:Protein flp [Beauveria bassiana]|uniref:Penicillin-binding protein n=1 Tax=Beauveria bassiana (strain ARSEF 2860) TaxID=655819 RepID=J4UK70_BEAB2|nr:penicillin-binding protein [Beauveria bassiana ARSEF 2860]EJP64502.1 penicillin-binding protein [Beauveria bassiana ARSEF 2860]KAF1735004.1 Protein flp [Beauveria bassiana]KAH8710521.1 Protein flp [Beauveria bassiana]
MARIHSLLLLLATAAPSIGVYAQLPAAPSSTNHSTSPFTLETDDFVASLLAKFQVPGCSVAVINGEETFTKGYGFATLPDVKATPETLWFGASTTKAFVGATLAHFVQNKTYPDVLTDGWYTPISSIIPDDFKLSDEWATKHINLDDAISHRTGLPRHDYTWQYTTPNGTRTSARDIVRNLRNLAFTAEPRIAYQYSNLIYMTLSHVIETLAKKPLKTTFKELIWGPLNMTSTFLDLAEAKASPNQLATGYYWDNATQKHSAITRDYLQEAGAAGIITSVVDHAKWVRSLLYSTGPLSENAHTDIKRPRVIAEYDPAANMTYGLYGLGWETTTFHNETLIRHIGESLSFGSLVWWMPDRKFGVVVMSNVYKQGNFLNDVLARHLVEDALSIPKAKRFDMAKVRRNALDELDRAPASAVDKAFPNKPDRSIPPSASINDLVGEYHNEGYGSLVFKPTNITITPPPTNGTSSGLALLAERPEMVYQYNVHLEHVSGDDWLAIYKSALGSRLPLEPFPSKFRLNGTAPELDILMGYKGNGVKQYTVTFKKVAKK